MVGTRRQAEAEKKAQELAAAAAASPAQRVSRRRRGLDPDRNSAVASSPATASRSHEPGPTQSSSSRSTKRRRYDVQRGREAKKRKAVTIVEEEIKNVVSSESVPFKETLDDGATALEKAEKAAFEASNEEDVAMEDDESAVIHVHSKTDEAEAEVVESDEDTVLDVSGINTPARLVKPMETIEEVEDEPPDVAE